MDFSYKCCDSLINLHSQKKERSVYNTYQHKSYEITYEKNGLTKTAIVNKYMTTGNNVVFFDEYGLKRTVSNPSIKFIKDKK